MTASEIVRFDGEEFFWSVGVARGTAVQLREAARTVSLVRFSRRFEPSTVCGYVFDVGPRFFLLALVSDRLWFDGFECFRIGDISDLSNDSYARFAEAALKKRGEGMPRKPRISLKSLRDLIVSVGRVSPLVTIHREEVRPDACWIGRVLGISRGRVSLLEINPDATWENAPTAYRLSEITRVNFGGDYEDALRLVGGVPPAGMQKRRNAR
jgi:hypothetical protein